MFEEYLRMHDAKNNGRKATHYNMLVNKKNDSGCYIFENLDEFEKMCISNELNDKSKYHGIVEVIPEEFNFFLDLDFGLFTQDIPEQTFRKLCIDVLLSFINQMQNENIAIDGYVATIENRKIAEKYKPGAHIHFPNFVVDKDEARKLARKFSTLLNEVLGASLIDETILKELSKNDIVDDKIYDSSLRTLCARKKIDKEKRYQVVAVVKSDLTVEEKTFTLEESFKICRLQPSSGVRKLKRKNNFEKPPAKKQRSRNDCEEYLENKEEIKTIISGKIKEYFPQAAIKSISKTTGTVWVCTLLNNYCWIKKNNHDSASAYFSITSKGILPKCKSSVCQNSAQLNRIPVFSPDEKKKIFNCSVLEDDEVTRKVIEEYDEKYAHALMGEETASLIFIIRKSENVYSSGTKTKFLNPSTFANFVGRDVTPDGRKKLDIWLNHPRHMIYENVVFLPGQDVENRKWFNMWQGFSYEPLQNFAPENYEEDEDLKLPLSFMKECVSSNDEETYNYILDWCADCAQKPWEVGEVALSLRGPRGIGKGFFAEFFGKLFGNHYKNIHASELVADFNGHVKNTVLLLADEMAPSNKQEIMAKLQYILTTPTIPVNLKFVEKFTIKNCLHVIITSNFHHMIGIDNDERRYCIIDVSDIHKNDRVYFRKIKTAATDIFYRKFLTMLLQRDISKWNRTKWPKRSLIPLWQNKYQSMDFVQRWFYDFIKNSSSEKWKRQVKKKFIETSIINQEGGKRITKIASKIEISINRVLAPHKINPSPPVFAYSNGVKSAMYVFPSLEECQKKFEVFVETPGDILWS